MNLFESRGFLQWYPLCYHWRFFSKTKYPSISCIKRVIWLQHTKFPPCMYITDLKVIQYIILATQKICFLFPHQPSRRLPPTSCTSQIWRQSNTWYCQLNKYASSFHIHHLAGYHQLLVIQQHIKSIFSSPHELMLWPPQHHHSSLSKTYKLLREVHINRLADYH